MKICHLTSVHPRNDTRILIKMCRSVAAQGHTVTLIVADGKGDAEGDGVVIRDVGASRGRFGRILYAPKRVYELAKKLQVDLYHLHDPELLPIGFRLMRSGSRVVFDSHEDVPKQMLEKPYLVRPVRYLIAEAVSVYERWICRRLSGVIAATPYIRDKFLQVNPRTVDINNFPLPEELFSAASWSGKQAKVCYVGGIAKIRGIEQMVHAMRHVTSEVRLTLAGQFFEPEVEQALRKDPGWQRVDALGFVGRPQVRDVLGESMAGLVTLHPLPNYQDALPVKMFEYMSAGIPVIASDFPLWRRIIGESQCGLLVDPLDPRDIARAIEYLVARPGEARVMGENGRRAVMERYNWPSQERKMLAFYNGLVADSVA